MANRKEFRFRKLDVHNFVIEAPCDGDSGRWRTVAYYSSLDKLLKRALREGIAGETPQELLASVKDAESAVLAALSAAVASGALSNVGPTIDAAETGLYTVGSEGRRSA